ncbi:MAG: hypothetical protein ACYDGR_16995 [Candidatus Dormibacteria bacterium]
MTLRIAGAIPVLAAALLTGLPALAATPATLALQYLERNQKADGSLEGGTANGPGETEDLVLGAAANGFDPNTLRAASCNSAYDYLASIASDGTALKDSKGNIVPAKVAKMTLAVVVGGLDPRTFGAPNPRDLLATLQATYQPGTGAYGAGAYAFDQSLAILALKGAANPSYPIPAAALTYLEGAQDADGGWGYFGSSDTNSTAMALMALAAAGANNGRAAALTYLHSEQTSAGNGGFAFSSAYGTTSDPDSDSIVIQGLVAAGQDPTTSTWTTGGKTPMSDLLTFQDPASSSPTYGGFTFTLPLSSNPPDTFTTSQVPAGLAMKPFPIARTYVSGTQLPGQACPAGRVAAASSPSPAATASPSPSPAVSPSPSAAASPSPSPSPASSPSPSPSVTPTPSGGTAPANLALTGGGKGAGGAGHGLPSGVPALLLAMASIAGSITGLRRLRGARRI